MQDKTLTLEAQINNPLLAEWTGPFGVPPFERIVPEYFAPAFAHAFAAHEAEIAAIAGNAAEPTFANTIEAMELSGAALTRVENLFHVLAGAHTNDAILAIERDLAPLEAKHWNRILMDEALFRRIDRARLLGYATFAHYRLDDAMAKTPEAVRALLDRVWTAAHRHALADRDALQALVQEEGHNFTLAAWDWRYYAEKLRKVRCDIEETAVKPYFQLERIIEAAFYTANRLFGLTFECRDGIPVWHKDVRVWEVRDAAGKHRGLFFGDYFARSSKHSGAWMTSLREQEKLRGDVRPLIVNVLNFSRAADGESVLLSFEDAKTLFHEFGHALHGLLSDVTYPMIAGTNVQ